MPKPWGGSDDVEILQRRVVALEAALRPFAKAYRDLRDMGVTANFIGSLGATEIAPQDFHRAAELVSEKGRGGAGG